MVSQRRALSEDARNNASQNAARILAESPFFQKSVHIACYLPYGSEFDSKPIIQSIWEMNKHCYIPVVNDSLLDFVSYHPNDPLKMNRYHILEPVSGTKIPLTQLDCVITPLIGFDLAGYRLGVGGGYYDRTFAAHFLGLLVGLAFSCQQIDAIPHDPWDIRLDGVITEQEALIFCSDKSQS